MTSLTDPFRSLMWLAVAAFCIGFAGFLALDRAAPALLAAQPAPAFATAGLSDSPV